MLGKYAFYEDAELLEPISDNIVSLLVGAGLSYRQAVDACEMAKIRLQEITYPSFSAAET